MKSLSKHELTALLTAAKTRRVRDWLMILVCYWHGLRASEVIGLTAASIADGHITVARLKGSEKTTQPLVQHEYPLFDEATALILFIQGMHPNQRVFPMSRIHFWRLVKKYSAEAGIAKRLGHPHILKHSIAMHCIDNTPIKKLQVYLGHKSMNSTAKYLEATDAEASAAVVGGVGSFDPKKPV